jgi:hypothetical protein
LRVDLRGAPTIKAVTESACETRNGKLEQKQKQQVSFRFTEIASSLWIIPSANMQGHRVPAECQIQDYAGFPPIRQKNAEWGTEVYSKSKSALLLQLYLLGIALSGLEGPDDSTVFQGAEAPCPPICSES